MAVLDQKLTYSAFRAKELPKCARALLDEQFAQYVPDGDCIDFDEKILLGGAVVVLILEAGKCLASAVVCLHHGGKLAELLWLFVEECSVPLGKALCAIVRFLCSSANATDVIVQVDRPGPDVLFDFEFYQQLGFSQAPEGKFEPLGPFDPKQCPVFSAPIRLAHSSNRTLERHLEAVEDGRAAVPALEVSASGREHAGAHLPADVPPLGSTIGVWQGSDTQHFSGVVIQHSDQSAGLAAVSAPIYEVKVKLEDGSTQSYKGNYDGKIGSPWKRLSAAEAAGREAAPQGLDKKLRTWFVLAEPKERFVQALPVLGDTPRSVQRPSPPPVPRMLELFSGTGVVAEALFGLGWEVHLEIAVYIVSRRVLLMPAGTFHRCTWWTTRPIPSGSSGGRYAHSAGTLASGSAKSTSDGGHLC